MRNFITYVHVHTCDNVKNVMKNIYNLIVYFDDIDWC